MSNPIDAFFQTRITKAGTVEVTLEEAQTLLRAAVGKATDGAIPDEEARAVAARTYHLAQAFNRALASGDEDLSSFAVDEELAKAIRQDIEGAKIVESVSEAMALLAERLGTEKQTPPATATATETPVTPPPPPPIEEPAQASPAESATTEAPAEAASQETAEAQTGPDVGGEPATSLSPPEDVHWPTDLNTPADPDGLDEWGRDPQ